VKYRVLRPGSWGERRNELIQIIKLLGAEYMRVLDRKSTHLVGPTRCRLAFNPRRMPPRRSLIGGANFANQAP